MDSGALVVYGPVLFVLVCVFIFLRDSSKRNHPSRRKRFRLRLIGGFVGNALMPLNAIVHPHAKYAVAEKMDQHAEDQDADPTDPMAHLRRQLKPIRNGEKIKRLTALKR